MDTKFNVVEVDRSAAEAYLEGLGEDSEITPDMEVGGGKVRVKVFQSGSQYTGTRSALAFLYTSARVKMQFADELSIYIKGISRYISAAKQHLGLKLTEGKDSLKQEAFELIAEHLFRSEDKVSVTFYITSFCLLASG